MCTLLFRHRPGDPHPLALLSNRDEQFERPSSGWSWREGPPRLFAPLDEKAGGTWIGMSASGIVAALTNVFPPLKDGVYYSRGSLVIEMLALRSASKARRKVRALLDKHDINKFNLLVADGTTAMMFSYDGRGLWEARLEPGVYQVGNDPWSGNKLDSGDGPNARWMEDHKSQLTQHPDICKHGDKYGTRSSSIILLNGLTPAESIIWHLEGYPCQSTYRQILGA
ncbi:MAG: NRDE family protein [Candidatus Marinimicrobia bacterium]|nr:NRDE family protein [Candidatus Neomarinimicrobiota bacterium]